MLQHIYSLELTDAPASSTFYAFCSINSMMFLLLPYNRLLWAVLNTSLTSHAIFVDRIADEFPAHSSGAAFLLDVSDIFVMKVT